MYSRDMRRGNGREVGEMEPGRMTQVRNVVLRRACLRRVPGRWGARSVALAQYIQLIAPLSRIRYSLYSRAVLRAAMLRLT
jgi:hypothetical protein